MRALPAKIMAIRVRMCYNFYHGKKIIKIMLVIFIVLIPISNAAAATFNSDVYHSLQIKVSGTSYCAAASILSQIHGKTAGTSSDGAIAIVIIMLIPFAMLINAIIGSIQSKLRSAPKMSRRMPRKQKPVTRASQTSEPFYLSVIIEQLKLYDAKIKEDKMSAEIKKMISKISDIDAASGGNKIRANNIENKLQKLFIDFFKYLDTYADFDTLSAQTDAICDTKQKIMEAAELLYHALNHTYDTLIDEIIDGISADTEALKNILAIKGLLKGTLDTCNHYKSEANEQQANIMLTAADNIVQKPVQESDKQSNTLSVTKIFKNDIQLLY
jgi:hypothetical protein